MEDSGYYSHRSSEFKFSSATGSTGRIPAPDDIFKLTFSDLNSPRYRYFRYGFTDEEDFEEFKQDLKNFRRLKREAREEFVDESPSPRNSRDSRSGSFSSSSGRRRSSSGEYRNPETVKVSERYQSEEEVREETGGDECTRRGHRRDKRNSREWPGNLRDENSREQTAPKEEPLGERSQVRRSVSLRGAAGEGARNKRNGVYFDEDCFLDEPQSRAELGTACAGASANASGITRVRSRSSDPCISGNEPQTPSPTTVPHTHPRKQRPCSSGRRVSFRETPETFPPTGDGDDDSVFSQDVNTPRCDAVKTHQTQRSASLTREQDGSKISKPISIPIQIISTPVKSEAPSENIDHNSARGCVRRERSGTAGTHENRQEKIDTARGDISWGSRSKTGDTPLRAPVTIPIRVERTREKATTTPRPSAGTRTQFKADSRDERAGEEGDERRAGNYRKIPKSSVSDSAGAEHKTECDFARPKRSGLLENLKRLSRSLERPRSGRGTDPFMEFFSGDEHFQEFERVFDTINNHRFSREMDYRRPGSWREGSTEKDPFDDSDDLGALHIDETFSDFFDHDEDFMEFERELEKIKSNRRSRLLENLNRRSSCDIFSDVKAFCDKSLSRSRQNLSNTSPKVERRTSARDSADPELWNSAEEWEFVMNKLKRNSRLFCDPPKASRADDTVPNTPTAGHSDQCPCLRDCQYTCHLNCVPSVTLDCTTVSPGSGGGPVATPTDLPSPSASAETSLTDRRTVVSHRSPQQQQQQQQQQQSSTSTPSRQLSQPCINVPHVQSVGASHQRTSPAQNVLLSSGVTDPLTGASVLQTSTSAPLLSSSSSSSTASSSQCVERDLNQNAKTCAQGDAAPECRLLGDDLLVCDVPNEKDETDSGYRSGTIPDEKLPKAPSQATLNRRELQRKIQTFNHFVPKATLEMLEDGLSFQGFIKVTLNLIRPITMELGARPPSIYELLTREHIVEQSTQHIAFYMPRDTVKSIHINSKTTTKEVITNLLKKFHILDNPRKFAMYEQEFNEKNKLVKLRRLTDKDFPLTALLSWDPEKIKFYRLVLQENETGEIVWDAFSLPELGNFLQVLDKEEQEAKAQLQYKYRIMRRIILQRLKELRKERAAQAVSVA